MKIDDFFGINIPPNQFDLNAILKKTATYKDIQNSKTVQRYIAETGEHHKIVSIAKRQLFLKAITPLVETDLLKYDSLWYSKEVNTAEAQDRQYGAEEKLLTCCLAIAAGIAPRRVLENGFKPSIKHLRDMKPSERTQRIWELLHSNTQEDIVNFQKSLAKAKQTELQEENRDAPTQSGGRFSKWINSLFTADQ